MPISGIRVKYCTHDEKIQWFLFFSRERLTYRRQRRVRPCLFFRTRRTTNLSLFFFLRRFVSNARHSSRPTQIEFHYQTNVTYRCVNVVLNTIERSDDVASDRQEDMRAHLSAFSLQPLASTLANSITWNWTPKTYDTFAPTSLRLLLLVKLVLNLHALRVSQWVRDTWSDQVQIRN